MAAFNTKELETMLCTSAAISYCDYKVYHVLVSTCSFQMPWHMMLARTIITPGNMGWFHLLYRVSGPLHASRKFEKPKSRLN